MNTGVTATLEQTQADLLKLVEMVQRGDEVVITSQGHPVARLTRVLRVNPPANRQAWLARLAELRQRLSTGPGGLTVEEILEEDRGD